MTTEAAVMKKTRRYQMSRCFTKAPCFCADGSLSFSPWFFPGPILLYTVLFRSNVPCFGWASRKIYRYVVSGMEGIRHNHEEGQEKGQGLIEHRRLSCSIILRNDARTRPGIFERCESAPISAAARALPPANLLPPQRLRSSIE